jgi:hypothetical protein
MAYPETNIDAALEKSMDVLFQGNVAQFQQIQALSNKSSAQLSNLTDNVFLQMTQLYQANAANQLQTNKLASDILAQRAAGGQPQSPAGDAGVNSGAPATK